jgi:uncharacterized protein YpmB
MMKHWKVWLIGAVAVVLLGFVALCSAVWNNISSEWTVEAATAQYALDHSPINHIDEHSRFTADGMQEVYLGTDAFGKAYYVFVYDQSNTVRAVPADEVVSKTVIQKRCERLGIQIEHMEIGYIRGKMAANGQGKASVVYEVYGQDKQGSNKYWYFDAKSGNLLWQYVLST